MKRIVQAKDKNVDDYVKELKKSFISMKNNIEERRKDFGRAYLKHVGNFLTMIEIFLTKLDETSKDIEIIPEQDIKLTLEPSARRIFEHYYALMKKVDGSDSKDDKMIEAVIIDIATSINYWGCLPLVITNDEVKSARTFPIIVKSERDPQDPVIIIVNPKISKNIIFVPLIGHEVAHLLEKDHKDTIEKNYAEELCCDYLATIIFGLSYVKAQLLHVSDMTNDEIYNIAERGHPPREYRISRMMMYLGINIDGRTNKKVQDAFNKISEEWGKRLAKNTPPKKYYTFLSEIDINERNTTALKHMQSIVKQYSIDIHSFIHNKHQRECPLSLIHDNSINNILNRKLDKTIKSKILDYSERLG